MPPLSRVVYYNFKFKIISLVKIVKSFVFYLLYINGLCELEVSKNIPLKKFGSCVF